MSALLIKDDYLPIYGLEDDCLINKEKGCLSYGFKVSYPAIYQKDMGQIEAMADVLEGIFSVLERNYIVHKQDWFFNGGDYSAEPVENESAMQRYNRIHFQGRKVRKQLSYIFFTKVPENYIGYGSNKTNRFLLKNATKSFAKTINTNYIEEKELREFREIRTTVGSLLNNENFKAVSLISDDFLGNQKSDGLFQLFKDFDLGHTDKDKIFKDNKILIGDRQLRFYCLQNNEQLGDYLPSSATAPEKEILNRPIYKSLVSPLGLELDCDHVLNQYFYIPDQRIALEEFQKKVNRLFNYTHRFSPVQAAQSDNEKAPKSLDATGNEIFMNETRSFISEIIEDNKKLVYTHINVGMLDKTYSRPSGFQFNMKENTADLHDLYFSSCPESSESETIR